MGYRSAVMALVYPATTGETDARAEQYELLKTLMNTSYKFVWEELGNCFEWVDRDELLKFACSDVKWYPSYPDVQAFEKFIEEIEAMGYDTEFIRVGENYDDIETKYSDNAAYHLSVRITIESEV